MKKIILPLCCLLLMSSYAQDVRDLVRYSQTQVFGSARFESMAGSFGALGADISTSSINPAGYGRYSSSTFGLNFSNTAIRNTATFNGTNTTEKDNSFKLNTMGFVLSNDVSERNRGWLFKQFGFSYNRIENFSDKLTYTGKQYLTLLDYFASSAEGMTVDDIYNNLPMTTALAWDTYAIDPTGSTSYAPRLDANTEATQSRTIDTYGGMSEYNFNLSGNYMNKLYVGGNIGFRTLNYREKYNHRETYLNNTQSLDSSLYTYNLKTKGSGTTIKLGIIYLPVQNLRLGLAIHSPVYFELTDEYDADLVAYHDTATLVIQEDYKPYGKYKYRMRTPPRVIGSLAYVFGTHGCINADIELVNYDRANFKSTNDKAYAAFDYAPVNNSAHAQTRAVLNIRVGGELVLQSQYFVRGGFGYYPSAYDPKELKVNALWVYSFGFGFKWKNNSIDLAYKYDQRQFNYYAFPESNTQFRSLRQSICVNYQVTF